jgi:hypothetical protein
MKSPKSQRWILLTRLALYLALASVVGCGTSALPPPVTVTYRDSFWGRGKVAQIYNNSAHHLYNIRVTGREYKKLNSASVKASDHLEPNSCVEVGWIEFGAWDPKPGESIEVYADNYVTPYVSIVPR